MKHLWRETETLSLLVSRVKHKGLLTKEDPLMRNMFGRIRKARSHLLYEAYLKPKTQRKAKTPGLPERVTSGHI